MPSAQAKFELPGGPPIVSTNHLDDEFQSPAGRPTADGLQVVLEAQTSDSDPIIRHLDEASWLPTYEVLHVDERAVLVEYSLDSLPSLYQSIISSGNLLQFPLELRDGRVVSEMVTSHAQLSKLKDAFESEGIHYEIDSVRQSTDPTSLLTDRQRRFVTEAVERGYYDTPRRCTLTELAADLNVSKSGTSGILHRAEERIIKGFVGEAAG